MSWIKFPKDETTKAKAEGNAVLVVGYDGPDYRYQSVSRMNPSVAKDIWYLSQAINVGFLTPEELAEVHDLRVKVFARVKVEQVQTNMEVPAS